ncbi:MAG: hypothetical protein ACXWJZ_01245 [Burkholderiaceae bacterium]
MPIDTSMYGNIQPIQLTNPLDSYGKLAALQSAQNQNSLFPMQMQSLQLANAQKQQQFDMIKPILARLAGAGSSSVDQSSPSSSPVGGGSLGTMSNVPPSNSQGVPTNDGVPYSLGDLAALSAAGYPGAAEMLKVKQAAMQGTEFKPGSTYERGGKTFTVPQLDKGMRIGADGNVEPIPGYSDTNAGIQGAQTSAQKQAENKNALANPALMTTDSSGKQIVVPGATLADQIAYLGGAQTAKPATTQTAPMNLGLQARADMLKSITDPAERQSFVNSVYKSFQGMPNADQAGQQWSQIVNGGGAPAAQATGGYTPPTTALDGTPLPSQATQALTSIAQSRDPAKLNQFVQTFQQNISHLPQDKQKVALDTLNNEVNGIQNYWKMPTQGAANTGGLVSPADIEADKQKKLAEVKLGTDPALTYANDAAKSLSAKAENVGGQLSESQALLQRIQESRDALSRFKAGGGAETRVQMAKYAQAIPGMPQSVIDGLAGGNLAAAQEFQKYAAQEALQTMRQALSSDTGQGSQGNRVAMQLFIKNNPNIDTDPNAIEKIFNFQTKLHNELLNKSDMLTKFIADPKTTKDPAIFDNLYAHSQIDSGNVKPQMTQGQAMGTKPKPIPTSNAQGWTLHVDAKGNKAYVSPDGKQFQEVQ